MQVTTPAAARVEGCNEALGAAAPQEQDTTVGWRQINKMPWLIMYISEPARTNEFECAYLCVFCVHVCVCVCVCVRACEQALLEPCQSLVRFCVCMCVHACVCMRAGPA